MSTVLYLLSAWLPHRGMLLLVSTCCGAFPVAQQVKTLPAMQETQETLGLEHCLEEKRRPTPVFLPEKSHGQRSLVTYSPWGCKELDMTEGLSMPPVVSEPRP